MDRLARKYHLICVNNDGFDGSDEIFTDMITVTEKIEKYIIEKHNGRIDGALGSSLGSSFVGQLIQRRNVHIDHGIFGSPDLDQSGRLATCIQSKLVLTLFTGLKKYLKRYRKYFHEPDIREYNMQHEQWLLEDNEYTVPVLAAIDEFMDTPV